MGTELGRGSLLIIAAWLRVEHLIVISINLDQNMFKDLGTLSNAVPFDLAAFLQKIAIVKIAQHYEIKYKKALSYPFESASFVHITVQEHILTIDAAATIYGTSPTTTSIILHNGNHFLAIVDRFSSSDNEALHKETRLHSMIELQTYLEEGEDSASPSRFMEEISTFYATQETYMVCSSLSNASLLNLHCLHSCVCSSSSDLRPNTNLPCLNTTRNKVLLGLRLSALNDYYSYGIFKILLMGLPRGIKFTNTYKTCLIEILPKLAYFSPCHRSLCPSSQESPVLLLLFLSLEHLMDSFSWLTKNPKLTHKCLTNMIMRLGILNHKHLLSLQQTTF